VARAATVRAVAAHLVFLALISAGMWPWLVMAARPGDDPGMQRLRDFLEQVDTLQARFQQDVIDPDQQLVERAKGTLLLRRPGQFRWDYDAPHERVIVADGRRIWMYEVDLAQVTVRPMLESLGETPAALLSGDADVLDRFEYQGFDRRKGLIWVRLRPISAASDFAYIRLGFDARHLVQLELEDRLGQKIHMTFDRIRVNQPIDNGAFRLKVPDGVDIIGDGDG